MTMDNTPIPTFVEGHAVAEIDDDSLGQCFVTRPDLTISRSALDLIGCENDMRMTEVGMVNMLAAALVTMASRIQADKPHDTTYMGEADKNVPEKEFNRQLNMAKRDAAIAITHFETGAMYLRKALERVA